ncbi:MAG TPA: TonB-dependent receptor, partial [Flavitalea sp.]|nr:TonB-dependent receptor [Flavitalea sp.]
MRNFFTLLGLFLLFTVSQAFAQNKNGRISGVVKDAYGKSVESATVSLLRAKDSSLAKVAVSNKNGEFDFDRLVIGKYRVTVSAVGFAKASSELLEISENNNALQLTDFQLAQSGKSLGEVTVTAKRPMVENKIDKMVVNVEAFITNSGGTALDVLEKSPGITVDRDGNVSLKGKQGVIILIDGKQTFLAGQDLANFLRNMPSNQLDQIEIMTQPSAKFDASGNSGVINIKTKKNKLAGFNGSINLTYLQAVFPKSPNSININYRKNKINLFSSYSYSYWQGFSDLNILRKFRDKTTEDVLAVFDQLSKNRFKSNNHNLRLGIDYSLNKKTTIGFVVNGTYNPRKFS